MVHVGDLALALHEVSTSGHEGEESLESCTHVAHVGTKLHDVVRFIGKGRHANSRELRIRAHHAVADLSDSDEVLVGQFESVCGSAGTSGWLLDRSSSLSDRRQGLGRRGLSLTRGSCLWHAWHSTALHHLLHHSHRIGGSSSWASGSAHAFLQILEHFKWVLAACATTHLTHHVVHHIPHRVGRLSSGAGSSARCAAWVLYQVNCLVVFSDVVRELAGVD